MNPRSLFWTARRATYMWADQVPPQSRGRWAHIVALLAYTLVMAGCVHGPAMFTPPAGEAGYSGLLLAADETPGARVVAVWAGPAAQAGVRVDDRLVAIEGAALAAEALIARLRTGRVDQRLTLTFARDGHTWNTDLTLARADDWRGPAEALAARPFAPREAAPPRWLAAALADLDHEAPTLREDARRIARMFDELAFDPRGRNRLPVTRAALHDPASALGEIEQRLGLLRAAARQPAGLPSALCPWFELDCPLPDAAPARADPASFAAALAALADEVQRAVLAGLARPRAAALADLDYLAAETARAQLIHGQAEAPRALRAMRDSLRFDGAALLPAFARLLALAIAAPLPAGEALAPPRALAEWVEGPILGYWSTPAGPVVFGARGANRYRMDRLLAVIDLDGDDDYAWDDGAAASVALVVDLAGDDRYRARRGGPGGAWLGVALTFDAAGDDDYRSGLGGCGAGLYGVGLLLDGAGHDRYRCDAWSLGAGLYGVGLALDRGRDADVYRAELLAEGVGGPAGLGVLLDEGGADLYQLGGARRSVYGSPAVYAGFGQGLGYGLRPFDHGGVGLLLDGGGDDRYEGGEFAQGGGYFGGLGVLADAGGEDLYYGQRYAQGFAAHQAVGALLDTDGDDHYWTAGAAAQGAAWDQGFALLFDGAGDDDYRGGDLSQGAAAQQAAALLYDAAGDDVYRSPAPAAQGTAGNNDYHFDQASPVASLGVLYDAAGDDRYASGLRAGALVLREPNADVANQDGRVGVLRDRAEAPRRATSP